MGGFALGVPYGAARIPPLGSVRVSPVWQAPRVKPRTGRTNPAARPHGSVARHPTGAGGAGPSTDAQGIQRLAGSRARTGSKVQQRFARLIKQVDQRKQRLRAWYDAQPAIHRELAAYRA